MKLLNDDGSYNYNSFEGANGVWTIIGSKSQSNHKDPFLCIDTFKSDKGDYLDVKREKVFQQAFKGKIKPVLSSAIPKSKTYSKKEWDKLIGRAQ